MSTRSNHKRRLLAGSAAVLALALVAACGNGDGDNVDEITMWTFLDPAGSSGREQVLASLIESYEEESGVTVNVEVQQWDTMTQQFLAADVSGSAPDVMWVALDQVSSAVEQGALADLNSLAFGDLPQDQLDGLRDVYWETMETDDGAIYGVVHSRNYFGIMYRADLLEEAGLDPEEIRTWDDLTAAAEELTAPAENRWGLGQAFATSFADPQIVSARLVEAQGAMFDDDGTPLWSTPEGVAALEFQSELVTEDQVTPEDAVRLTAEDLYELFSAGQVAMINAASVRVPTMQEQVGAENVGFMHYPSEDGESPGPGNLAGWSVGVWSGSEATDEASDFVAHLSSPEADEQWMLDAQQPPLYAATAEENADFLAEPENEFLSVALEGAEEYGWLPPTNVPTAGWREGLNTAVQQALLGEATPQEAMDTAAQSLGSGGNG